MNSLKRHLGLIGKGSKIVMAGFVLGAGTAGLIALACTYPLSLAPLGFVLLCWIAGLAEEKLDTRTTTYEH